MDLETLSSNSRFSTAYSMSESRFRHSNSKSPFRSPKGSRFKLSKFNSPSGFHDSEEENSINDDFDISLTSSIMSKRTSRARKGKPTNPDSESIGSIMSVQNEEVCLSLEDNNGEDECMPLIIGAGNYDIPEDDVVGDEDTGGAKTEGENLVDYEGEEDYNYDAAYNELLESMDVQKKEMSDLSKKLDEKQKEINRLKAENMKLRRQILNPAPATKFPSAKVNSIVGTKKVGARVFSATSNNAPDYSQDALEAMTTRNLVFIAQRLKMDVKPAHRKYLSKSPPSNVDVFKKEIIKYILKKSSNKRKSPPENNDGLKRNDDSEGGGGENKRHKKGDDEEDDGRQEEVAE